ncbi:hypothetical protein RQP46_003820 [Phenoliferia psychrophenolica]
MNSSGVRVRTPRIKNYPDNLPGRLKYLLDRHAGIDPDKYMSWNLNKKRLGFHFKSATALEDLLVASQKTMYPLVKTPKIVPEMGEEARKAAVKILVANFDENMRLWGFKSVPGENKAHFNGSTDQDRWQQKPHRHNIEHFFSEFMTEEELWGMRSSDKCKSKVKGKSKVPKCTVLQMPSPDQVELNKTLCLLSYYGQNGAGPGGDWTSTV